jgi:hypothetical protein
MAQDSITSIGTEICLVLERQINNAITKDLNISMSNYYQQFGTYNGYSPQQDVLIFNPDGTISVYLEVNKQTQSIDIGSFCCKTIIPKIASQPVPMKEGDPVALFSNITTTDIYWDDNTQKCRWKKESTVSCLVEDFKIVLNPDGNDGILFNTENGEKECKLVIDFDYLFKLDCDNLANILNPKPDPKLESSNVSINPRDGFDGRDLTSDFGPRQLSASECEELEIKLQDLIKEYDATYYSIHCDNVDTELYLKYAEAVGVPTSSQQSGPVYKTVTPEKTASFSKTGFGGGLAFPQMGTTPITVGINEPLTVCLNEPEGLAQWGLHLGPDKFQRFLNGDPTSYTCGDLIEFLLKASEALDDYTEWLFECNTPFGYKTKLKEEIEEIKKRLEGCVETPVEPIIEEGCKTPAQVLETLDVSVTVDVVENNGDLTTVFDFNLFPAIGEGNLYNYLSLHPTDSAFYVCGEPKQTETFATGCTVIKYQSTELTGSIDPVLSNCSPQTPSDFYCNVQACVPVKDNILKSIFEESGFSNSTEDLNTFKGSLSQTILASNWVKYATEITDPEIISKIEDKKITLTIKINNNCSNICVLIDNIKMDKVCIDGNAKSLTLTKSPGFELERIIDNKKSWIRNTELVNRDFDIKNVFGNNRIRQTDYDVNDERLVINTKEIDLDINLANAVENDVWCYIVDNPCLLTGETNVCSGLTVTDYSGNVVTLPTTQTVADCSAIVQDAYEYLINCFESVDNPIQCLPTTECNCGKVFKILTKGPTVGALWITCSSSGLSFYHISDISDVQGTITNVTDSFTQDALDSLNNVITEIKNALYGSKILNYKLDVFWGNSLSNCDSCCNSCGDDTLNFNEILSEPLSNVDSVDEFKRYLTSQLIDAKDRKTLSAYPTLRALYDRYMNSTKYCENESSKFTYMTMEMFASLVGDYWVDIVEQVVPATTIWGSVKIYSNTIFDQQKFKYKKGSLFTCKNEKELIEDIYAFNMGVDVDKITLTIDNTVIPNKKIQKCSGVYMKQLNNSSEFIGSVTIMEGEIKTETGTQIGLADTSIRIA